MKSTYYLLKDKDQYSIYLVAELPKPPPMDSGVLDVWISGHHEELILGYGCSQLFVIRNTRQIRPRHETATVIDSWELDTTPEPSWLVEHNCSNNNKIERCLFTGEPTYYTHLVPIEPLGNDGYSEKDTEPFVSADPLADPVYFDNTYQRDRVLVTGCWDLFHAGHVTFLNRVYDKYVGGYNRDLYVGMPDDTSCTFLKGRSPVFSFQEKARILEACRYVKKVVKFQLWRDVPPGTGYPEDGHRQLLDEVKPILFVDSLQKPKERIGALPYLRERKIPIEYVNSIDVHTTDIIERIKS